MPKYCMMLQKAENAFVRDALARPDYDLVLLRKGFGFVGAWTVCEQNQLLALCFSLPQVNKI
jgi:hypothetical protein